MTDTKKIEFLQSKTDRNIKSQLQKSINNCISVKGAIAYWTIDIEYFDGLADKLSHEESFICVDIHQPTNIKYLAEFAEKSSNIYLFPYRVETGRHPLMHTKLLLFYLPGDEVEIWIGSQNFTDSAIAGFNFESTIIITTSKNSILHEEILSYIEFIKKSCEDIGKMYPEIGEQFNPKFVDFYEKLQQSFDFQEENHDVIDVLCEDIKVIQSIAEDKEKFVLIASFDEKDIKISIKNELLIRVLDKEGQKVCYRAKVYSIGIIKPINKESDKSKAENSFVTTYLSSDKKPFEIESYIVRTKNKIPIFISSKPYNATDQEVSVIIGIIEEFKKELYPSKKGDFWKIPKTEEGLTYLSSVQDKKEKEKIKIPKHPDAVKQKSTYPFETISRSSPREREECIERLYKEVDQQFKLVPPPNDVQTKVNQKQRIVRKMVSAKTDEESE